MDLSIFNMSLSMIHMIHMEMERFKMDMFVFNLSHSMLNGYHRKRNVGSKSLTNVSSELIFENMAIKWRVLTPGLAIISRRICYPVA